MLHDQPRSPWLGFIIHQTLSPLPGAYQRSSTFGGFLGRGMQSSLSYYTAWFTLFLSLSFSFGISLCIPVLRPSTMAYFRSEG